MARKRSNRNKKPILEYRRMSTGELRRLVEEQGGKGDLRAAIDVAKECYRREQTAAHANLLSEAYVRRARQLMERGLHAEATVVLGHALALGQRTPELLRLVFECGLRSRQYAPAVSVFEQLQDPAERERVRRRLIDEAVARGEELGRFCDPIIREDATRIRQAFTAFEQGDDQAAAAELKRIALRSPCADWKWVLLGLTAYANRDEARARNCWDRTRSDGKAHRLASLLQSMVAEDEKSNPGINSAAQARLSAQFGNSQLDLLEQIEQTLDRGEPAEVLRLCKRLLANLDAKERPVFARRLARAVCPFVVKDMDDPLRELPALFGPLPEDPRYTRTLALALEDDDPLEAVFVWYCHVEHLREVEAIPKRLRSRARAMIWARMGDLARRISPESLPMEVQASFRHRAPRFDPASCYGESIKAYPDDVQVREKLLETLSEAGKENEAEQTAGAILERWPQHVKSMLYIAKQCFERDAYRKAIKYFDCAREAEPFNADVRREMQACLLFSARRRLTKGNLSLARKDYEQAETLIDPGEPCPELYCKWAALEWRAGAAERAAALAAKAEAGTEALWVYCQMAIETARADAPIDVQNKYDRLLAKAWRGRPTAAGAVSVAELTLSHVRLNVQYAQRGAHHTAVLDYLKRACKRVDFAEDQLLPICCCLKSLAGWNILEDYARRASRKYPDNYHYPVYLGHAQRARGKRHLPRSTARLLERAGQQAVQAGDLKAADEICGLLDPVFDGPFSMGGVLATLLDLIPEEVLPELVDELEAGMPPSLPGPMPRSRRSRRPRKRRPADQLVLFDDPSGPVSEEE